MVVNLPTPGAKTPVKKLREAAKKACTVLSSGVNGQGSSVSLQVMVNGAPLLDEEDERQKVSGR